MCLLPAGWSSAAEYVNVVVTTYKLLKPFIFVVMEHNTEYRRAGYPTEHDLNRVPIKSKVK